MKLRALFSQKFGNRGQIDKMIDLRRKNKNELQGQQDGQQDLQAFWTSPQTDITISLQLYFQHDCHKSQSLYAILNYYQISFEKQDNFQMLDMIRKSKVVNLQSWQYPLLKVNVSLNPVEYITGPQEIQQYLIRKELIINPIHLTNSLKAEQGIEFIHEKIKKPLDTLFLNPALAWQNIFKLSISGLKKDPNNRLLLPSVFRLTRRAFRQIPINIYQILSDQASYNTSKQRLEEGMTEWIVRLNQYDFHGGQTPDEADFELFGIILARYNSISFKRYVENKCPYKFYQWFIRMQSKCQYDPDRYFIDQEQNKI
ncbi:hypothetical protein pb186bvf_010091 [Paramecium bursaria]